MVATALSAMLLGTTACPLGASSDSDEVLAQLLGTYLLAQLQISGSWNYYNGTPSYTDTCGGFCSDGNVKVGTYSFASANFQNSCQNTKDCGTPLPSTTNATVVEYSNERGVLYAKYDSTHPFTPNKFTFIRWISSGGYFYICPDISDVGSQDTLAKARDFNNDGVEDAIAANNVSNLNGGCSGLIFWTRLQTN